MVSGENAEVACARGTEETAVEEFNVYLEFAFGLFWWPPALMSL